MSTEEDLKKAEDAAADEAEAGAEPVPEGADAEVRPPSEAEAEAEAEGVAAGPMQMGYKRYVYAAFMAGAMGVGFLTAKIGHVAWYRLGQWKPDFGEPKDEIVFPIAGLIGVLVALYYWRKPESRQYANEVAEELSKVTWPSRKEVTNSTAVVVFTTVFATVFFALMDQFWKYVTDKIYSF